MRVSPSLSAVAGMLLRTPRRPAQLVAPPPPRRRGKSGAAEQSPADAATPPVSQPQSLTNPFRGLHEHLTRSYRLDQLLSLVTERDLMFGRQERKSTAFSFLRFEAGVPLYEKHWSSLPDLRSQHAAATTQGKAVPGFTLFNNDLGLDNPRVQSSAPLIVAQRLLLLPDTMRHFHALCGRTRVPCDFFADVDLPDTTPEEGESVLLEILNYLEVRLPGIGFTDPFFLVLSNDVPQPDKASYHIHARSMTFVQERLSLSLGEVARMGGNSPSTGAGTEDAEEHDDLTDLVNVVEGLDTKGKKGSGGAGKRKKTSAPTVIAFQDYTTVKLLADEVNQTIGRNVIDENCYRLHGMLRCAFNHKLSSSQDHNYRGAGADATRKRLMPLLTAKDSALQRKLSAMEEVLRTMTDPEILELTFCNRYVDDTPCTKRVHEYLRAELPTNARGAQKKLNDALLKSATRHRFQLLRPRHILGPQSARVLEYDVYGNMVSPFLTEAAKWRRYKAVIAKLRTIPPRGAESHDIWVRVGLALHNFSNEDHVFEEWVRFSIKCPQKYSREVCRKKWVQFERNPDALNWRRGYNYLNSTVWRQL